MYNGLEHHNYFFQIKYKIYLLMLKDEYLKKFIFLQVGPYSSML